MKGLIIKDLYNLRKQLVLYIIIGVIYSVIGVVAKDSGGSSFTGLILIFSAMLPITAVSYDERAKWDKYGLTMPVSRRETVAAKYLLGVILTAAGALLSFAVGLLFGADMTEYAAVVTMLAGICFLYLSVLLPIVYKMGTEKARFIMLAVILLPFLLIMAGALYAKNSVIGGTKIPENMLGNMSRATAEISGVQAEAGMISELMAGILIFTAVSLVIMYISYRISVSIYRRKEF